MSVLSVVRVNLLRLFLVVLLVSFGAGFFCLWLQKREQPPTPQSHWSYRVTLKDDQVSFYCKANTYYTFRSQHGYSKIFVDGRWHSNGGIKYKLIIQDTFFTKFSENKRIILECDSDGIWFKTGKLDVWEGKQEGQPRIYLTPAQYSDISLKAQKGQSLTIPEQIELYHIGFFKGGKLARQELVKRDVSTFYFLRDTEVRFKAAEVPFFLAAATAIPESIYVNGIRAHAIFLCAGESIKTPYWLDRGDTLWINHMPYPGTLQFAVGSSQSVAAVSRFNQHNSENYDDNWYVTAAQDGFLRIRASRDGVIVGAVKISHNRSWRFDLKPGQTKKLSVTTGDVLHISCRTRYFINGSLMSAGEYDYPCGTGTLEFKASVDPEPINISVTRRRGY